MCLLEPMSQRATDISCSSDTLFANYLTALWNQPVPGSLCGSSGAWDTNNRAKLFFVKVKRRQESTSLGMAGRMIRPLIESHNEPHLF